MCLCKRCMLKQVLENASMQTTSILGSAVHCLLVLHHQLFLPAFSLPLHVRCLHAVHISSVAHPLPPHPLTLPAPSPNTPQAASDTFAWPAAATTPTARDAAARTAAVKFREALAAQEDLVRRQQQQLASSRLLAASYEGRIRGLETRLASTSLVQPLDAPQAPTAGGSGAEAIGAANQQSSPPREGDGAGGTLEPGACWGQTGRGCRPSACDLVC